MTPSRGVTPERKKFRLQIYKEQWTNEVRKVKRCGATPFRGDNRVKSIKVIVMSKKGSQFFQEKINRSDTAELADRQTVMTKRSSVFSGKK